MNPNVWLDSLNLEKVVLVSGANNLGPYYIGDFEHFDVTIKSCATAVIPVTLTFAPFADAEWFSTATNFTATSLPVGSGTDSFITNHRTENDMRYMRLQLNVPPTGGYSAGYIHAIVHGTKKG